MVGNAASGINYGAVGGNGTLGEIIVQNPSAPFANVYSYPKKIVIDTIAADSAVAQLYNGSYAAEPYMPGSPTILIGETAGGTYAGYYPVASENGYTIFGFTSSFNNLTTNGRNFLVNLVYAIAPTSGAVLTGVTAAQPASGNILLVDYLNKTINSTTGVPLAMNLYNVTGLLVKQTNGVSMDFSSLTNGVYIVRAEGPNGYTTQKIAF